jgi:hypothetical protein
MSNIAMDSESWIGWTLIDHEGRDVGVIDAIYFDQDSGLPQWMAVDSGLDGGHSFVPLADAAPTEDAVMTPYAKSQIDDAPTLAADEDLPDDRVLALYGHYGLPYESPDPGVGEVAAPDPALAATDPGTQSEQDMRIATGQATYAEPVTGDVVYEVPAAAGERDVVVRRTAR